MISIPPCRPTGIDGTCYAWEYDQRGLLVERRREIDPTLAPVVVQWSAAAGGNGHWYQLSSRPVNGLDDAIQLAASTTLPGVTPGYVVSILSEGEKDFLVGAFGGTTHYLIGYTDGTKKGLGVGQWRVPRFHFLGQR